LHADAVLKPADIDGIATAGETTVTVAHYVGLTPKWVDGTPKSGFPGTARRAGRPGIVHGPCPPRRRGD
jgi:hypothetical protein